LRGKHAGPLGRGVHKAFSQALPNDCGVEIP